MSRLVPKGAENVHHGSLFRSLRPANRASVLLLPPRRRINEASKQKIHTTCIFPRQPRIARVVKLLCRKRGTTAGEAAKAIGWNEASTGGDQQVGTSRRPCGAPEATRARPRLPAHRPIIGQPGAAEVPCRAILAQKKGAVLLCLVATQAIISLLSLRSMGRIGRGELGPKWTSCLAPFGTGHLRRRNCCA